MVVYLGCLGDRVYLPIRFHGSRALHGDAVRGVESQGWMNGEEFELIGVVVVQGVEGDKVTQTVDGLAPVSRPSDGDVVTERVGLSLAVQLNLLVVT